jgi:hypothetical protein
VAWKYRGGLIHSKERGFNTHSSIQVGGLIKILVYKEGV